VWSLADAAYWTKQGLWPLAGNTLAVEDVFSTWLYTGNGSTQTITNGIDLAGKGGLVWCKARSAPANFPDHVITDTARGATVALVTNVTDGNNPGGYISALNQFNSNGFSLNGTPTAPSSTYPGTWSNQNGQSYVSWTFREAPNFFDVVTYTGTGANRNIAHNLGSVPGMIIVKRTDTTGDWQVYHRSNANTQYMVLNSNAAVATGTTRWNSTTPTATEFTVGTDATVNASGGTYVAYLYAHVTASDGIIQCGSYTGNGSSNGPEVNLGWEPQWLLIKNASGSGRNWLLFDNMRGMVVGSADAYLVPNAADAEASFNYLSPTATGFQITATDGSVNNNGQTFIYVAIRRGPMKTPTLGTSVFAVDISNATGSATSPEFVSNFPVDMYFLGNITNTGGADKWYWMDRLRGNVSSNSTTTAAESAFSVAGFAFNTGVFNTAVTSDYYATMFRRAPGFFDEVCYTGTAANRTISHNLGVVPEMMIVKARNAGESWFVYSASLLATEYVNLDLADAKTGGAATTWNSTRPTASVFSVGTSYNTNGPYNYVAYLFASCPGVSKVGSYTGNGSSQTINCAFTTGARYVLIKRTNVAGDWYVWDSARGIVAGNDPYLALNTTAAEVTSNDSVDTDNTGFIVNQVAASNVNVNGAAYIFLAIA
jgi:hypothetical protein